ncbi:hypothetical protein D3C80_1285450 [compost metagenome]
MSLICRSHRRIGFRADRFDARIKVQGNVRLLDLSRKSLWNLIKRRKMNSLEAFDLVILVAVFKLQRFQSRAFRQISPGGKIELNDIVAGRDPFFLQVVLEGGHVVSPHAKDIQRFESFQMHPFGAIGREGALEGHSASLEAHPAPEQLDDLRAFTLPHIQEAHGGNAPARPTLGEFSRADENVQLAARVVDRFKQARSKVVGFAVKILNVLRVFEEAGIIANVDQAKRISRSNTQRQFPLAVFQVHQLEALAGISVEKTLQDIVIYCLCISLHQRDEAAGKNVVALGVQEARFVRDQIRDP